MCACVCTFRSPFQLVWKSLCCMSGECLAGVHVWSWLEGDLSSYRYTASDQFCVEQMSASWKKQDVRALTSSITHSEHSLIVFILPWNMAEQERAWFRVVSDWNGFCCLLSCFPGDPDVLCSSIGSMAHSGTGMANPWGSGVKCRLHNAAVRQI